MGQYYMALNLTNETMMCWHKYDNGIKLMEHSYIWNNFVDTFIVENLLNKEAKIVWAGDYANSEENTESDEYEDGENLYSLSHKSPWKEIVPVETTIRNPVKYILNLDKKEYIEVPERIDDKLQIHPLPLLTAEWNGKGGWDYRGTDLKLIGSWARDTLIWLETWEALLWQGENNKKLSHNFNEQ